MVTVWVVVRLVVSVVGPDEVTDVIRPRGCPLGVKLGVLATWRLAIATPLTLTAMTLVIWSWVPSWIVAAML